MANGQPFYNYMSGGYTPYQAPNFNIYSTQQAIPQMPQMPQMAQNATAQPMNNFQGQQMQTPQSVMPTKTNVPLVTSLTEAMSRTTELNSDTFYADQDKPVIYRVSVDMQGRKSYRTFEIKDVTEQEVEQSAQGVASNVDLSAYATKEDLRMLRDEITNYAMAYLNPSTTPKPKKTDKADKAVIAENAKVKTESEEIIKE